MTLRPLAPSSPRLTNVLLAVATTTVLLLVVCVIDRLAARRPVELEDLDAQDRQRLIESYFTVAGDGYRPAWFAPELGYTLRPNEELTLWGDTFVSNALGYRAGAVEKTPGVERWLFVGDSWTYGMGVPLAQSIPMQVEALANQLATDRPVEAWSLALPGYNTLNELAALELFYDRLRPDVVVICPTRNDNDSTALVLPNGSTKRPTGKLVDRFGDDHAKFYRARFLDAYRYEQRWATAYSALREASAWLDQRGVPTLLAFLAYWEPPVVHRWMAEVGVDAPYVVLPNELAQPPWRGPPPWGHGTPEAYRLMARQIYRPLAELLGRPELPEADFEPAQAELHRRPPAGDWAERSWRLVREHMERTDLETIYRAGRSGPGPCVGPMDCHSGRMGRATTVLLRRAPGTEILEIALGRLAGPTALYPLEVSATVPSVGGGATTATTVPSTGPAEHRFVLPLPTDIEEGSAFEVELRSDRTTLASGVLAVESLYVLAIEQRP